MAALSSWTYYGKENNTMRLCWCLSKHQENNMACLSFDLFNYYVMGKGFDYLW